MNRLKYCHLITLIIFAGLQSCNANQLLMAYYSGIALDTVGKGGLNALALAFFNPSPLGTQNCDFANVNTPCLIPATDSGNKNLAWALSVFNASISDLSKNTSPTRGGKPTIFFSFGGQSQGGAVWDQLLGGSAATATQFGTNAGKLVTTVYNTIGQKAFVGFDLDVEGTSTNLPQLGAFVKAFRAVAPYATYPLQLCALSGIASTSSSDHFKVDLMKQYGPAQGGINYLNMMVSNVDASCSVMESYWLDSALDFLPPANKVLGVWGMTLPSWILHAPGCTDGSNPLFAWISKNGVSIGIWQWWSGDTTPITSLINAVRQG